ncbi:MAG: cupin domain-containing protein [Acidiferrobacterales bacterium]
MTQHEAKAKHVSPSRVLKYENGFTWQDAVRKIYKDEPGSWQGVTRTALIGSSDETPTPFHLRYFEVEVGGFSSLEKHQHEHIVVLIRGRGEVVLGDYTHPLSFGDVVYIAPWEIHQFRNALGPEPLGFLCMVPAERDHPVLVTAEKPRHTPTE